MVGLLRRVLQGRQAQLLQGPVDRGAHCPHLVAEPCPQHRCKLAPALRRDRVQHSELDLAVDRLQRRPDPLWLAGLFPGLEPAQNALDLQHPDPLPALGTVIQQRHPIIVVL
jgi:hypothetical protein